MRSSHGYKKIALFVVVAATFLGGPSLNASGGANFQARRTATLPDLSGLAWVDGDRFLAVHDSKYPDESRRVRVSLLWLPSPTQNVTWTPLKVDWPQPLGMSGDLESIARIPGTSSFLLVESGETSFRGQRFHRIFLAELQGQRIRVKSFTTLPDTVKNIEGTAVANAGGKLFFIFAERADGKPGSNISWAELQLQPLKLGAAREAFFKMPDFAGPDMRPVSALEVDSRGRIYAASASDPDDDNGPFRSVIWRIGEVKSDGDKVAVDIDDKAERIAILDGLKVEGLAIREREGSKPDFFVGMDDENYGGALRLIPYK